MIVYWAGSEIPNRFYVKDLVTTSAKSVVYTVTVLDEGYYERSRGIMDESYILMFVNELVNLVSCGFLILLTWNIIYEPSITVPPEKDICAEIVPSVPTLAQIIEVISPKPEQVSVDGRVTSGGNLN